MKAAILKQLEFEKDIIDKIGKLAPTNISKEEKDRIEIDFLNSKKKANKLESSVNLAQEAFALEHNFKLQKK